MVGKTYLRYVVGPQGGAVASNASLTIESAVIKPTYEQQQQRHQGWHNGNNSGNQAFNRRPSHGAGGGYRHQSPSQRTAAAAAASAIFTPSLEAVRVYSVRSGALLHTLIPQEAKMPVEVTSLRVVPLEADSTRSLMGISSAAASSPATTTAAGATSTTTAVAAAAAASSTLGEDVNVRIQRSGWLLLVGYNNGCVAVFSCGETNNYGKPVCRFYALGHKVDTNVLATCVDRKRSLLCSAGQDTDITVWDLASQEPSFRMRGHRGGVVGLEFAPGNDRFVISAAADGLIKVWDTEVRQCVQTLVASDTQVTCMTMDSVGARLYCGLRENYIKVYNAEALCSGTTNNNSNSTLALGAGGGVAAAPAADAGLIADHGTIARKYHKPLTNISFSADGAFILACSSKTVEVFRVRSSEDVKKKVLRKRKRKRPVSARDGNEGESAEDEDGEEKNEMEEEAQDAGTAKKGGLVASSLTGATAAEEVTLLRTFFMTHKVRSACFVPGAHAGAAAAAVDQLHIAVTFNNNNVQTYSTELTLSELDGAATWSLDDLKPRHTLEQRGHQSDIRALQFVDNDSALLSLSKEKVMMWTLNVRHDLLESDHTDHHDFYDAKEANLVRADFKGSLNCVASVPLGESTNTEAVSMAAISSHVCCIGMSDGTVQLVDVASGEVVFNEPAFHMGGVKHVVKRHDDSGFLSVGADRRLVLWTIGLLQDEKTATLVMAQEVELTEFPLLASFSPDGRFLGVGLQSNNIQLFFADSLKPYLSLFGHKLPPTSLAFSTDGTLVASVGMDKSLRFWGTDFGDCHRAIHAHDDYVTQVEFVKDTHYVFTVSMDGSIKQWDGDNWTMIQLFRQHQRGLWSVAVTKNATCVAAAGQDKCIRCFLRTQDIVFPEEEEEKMAQTAMDEETAKRIAMQKLSESAADAEVGVAGQQTAATTEAAERIMEALDLVSIEQQRKQNPDDTSPRHPLLLNSSNEWEYLWSVIESVRPSEIRHALASLTSTHVDALLEAMVSMIHHRAVLNYETAARIVLALVLPAPGLHQGGFGGQAVAVSGEVSEMHGARRLDSLRRSIATGLDASVGRMDYNIAGLQLLRQHLEDTERVRFFDISKIQGYKKKYHSRALPS